MYWFAQSILHISSLTMNRLNKTESLVVSLMASFVFSFFQLDVLHEIWDVIGSVSGGFLTYSLM